jgi:hypothetical protein
MSLCVLHSVSCCASQLTQWNKVQVSEGVPGFDTLLASLSAGSLVYVEGNLRVTTKKDDPADRYGSNFVHIAVTRVQGTFRLLAGGGDRGSGVVKSDVDGLPF